MQVAGIELHENDAAALIALLRTAGYNAVAEKLQAEVEGHFLVGLTIVEREAMLRALDDPPTDGLAHLRAVLLRDHEWFKKEGLS